MDSLRGSKEKSFADPDMAQPGMKLTPPAIISLPAKLVKHRRVEFVRGGLVELAEPPGCLHGAMASTDFARALRRNGTMPP